MRLLLDTCALLWFADGSDHLSERAVALLEDDRNEVFVSVASYWEVVLKYAAGRLALPCPPDEWFTRAVDPDAILAIEAADITAVHGLGSPREHKDPFDRVLIATAQRLGLSIVTSDAAFQHYDVSVEW